MDSEMLKSHLVKTLAKKMRFDRRKLDEYRPITLEYGVTKNAEGSARVKIGDTEVIVGIKMSVEKPYPDTPDEGNLMVGAELLPIASPDFEPGPPADYAIELARVVDRGIRESRTIDNKKLCIEKGEKVWMVSVDICTINDDGNLFDASALAAVAAIRDARFPKYDGTTIDYKELTEERIPVIATPISVTVVKVGETFLIDPNNEEEKFIDARLTVTTTEDGSICALQKGGEDALAVDEIEKLIELGAKKAVELSKYL